jgi:uncharacterized damage-inducible protein DinB
MTTPVTEPTSHQDLRYPIGCFSASAVTSTRAQQIDTLRQFPAQLRDAVRDLSDAQLDTPYRESGWTVRQLVHHIADSHTNLLIRFKLALTENSPTIKPYDEAAWAKLADSSLPIDCSLAITEGVHTRIVALLESLQEADFAKSFLHPESGPQTVGSYLAVGDWHSRHHLAHITTLRQRMGW